MTQQLGFTAQGCAVVMEGAAGSLSMNAASRARAPADSRTLKPRYRATGMV
ncbi:MAG: hypothetical protein ACRDQ4_10680 [Pseudonocardiaceae bacterium]